ncbi:MAG: helix-turn-helix domain-containing protein, partial [Candidatus Diapherotrites archaeon]|nr:helix-turn-helix domain-containing protein [Candidatus Diapherotrites archaeon]
MEEGFLVSLGLTKKQAEVFLTLLKSGEVTASALAKKVKISRPNVYDDLNKLVELGLASYVIKNNLRFFKSAPPEKLFDFLKVKEERIKQLEGELKEILPKFKSLQKKSGKKVNVEVFDGWEGLKNIFYDALRQTVVSKKEMVIIGAASGYFRKRDPIWHKKYYLEREKFGVKARYLFTEGADVVRDPMIKLRMLPKQFKSPAITWVYGDKVSFLLQTEDDWIGIAIESSALADSYRD